MISHFSINSLQNFAQAILLAKGFSEKDALLSAQLLTRADLRGVDSHGIARLSGYIRLIDSGRLNPKPQFQWQSRFPTQCLLDADASIGFLSAHAAMEKTIEMAARFGMGSVAVKNSNHFGIAGQYALMAAEDGMVGLAFTNASPLVAPTHSRDRMLGTNPIAVAIPSGVHRPFVLDMATTTAANGKLEILQRKNLAAPDGWIQNLDGQISNDPKELSRGGALLPLGSFPEMSSHKGYGLGSVVDIFSGVLSGANFGPWVPPFVPFLEPAKQPVGEGIGHFFMAFRVDGFGEKSEFLARMDAWMDAFRNSESIENQPVLVPGDPEWKMEDERIQSGIPLLEPVINDLKLLSQSLDIPMPEPMSSLSKA